MTNISSEDLIKWNEFIHRLEHKSILEFWNKLNDKSNILPLPW